MWVLECRQVLLSARGAEAAQGRGAAWPAACLCPHPGARCGPRGNDSRHDRVLAAPVDAVSRLGEPSWCFMTVALSASSSASFPFRSRSWSYPCRSSPGTTASLACRFPCFLPDSSLFPGGRMRACADVGSWRSEAGARVPGQLGGQTSYESPSSGAAGNHPRPQPCTQHASRTRLLRHPHRAVRRAWISAGTGIGVAGDGGPPSAVSHQE